MADIERINSDVIYSDRELGFEPIISEGIVQEQPVSAVAAASLLLMQQSFRQ